jgi:chromosome segregation ATPase
VRAEPTAITRGKHTVNLEEILGQCKDAAALRQQLINVIEQRDALILEAERNAAIAETVQKERDSMKFELQDLRAQHDAQSLELANLRIHYEGEISLLKQDVRILKNQRGHLVDQDDVLILRAQHTAEDLEAVKKMRDSLKIELGNLQAYYTENVTQLEDELRKARTQCDQLICQQCVLLSRAQRAADDSEAVKKMRDSLKIELGNLRAYYKEDVTQLEDQLRKARTQCDQLMCERRVLISRAQRAAEDLEALKMRETLNHQGQCKDSALLEKQVKNLRAELQKVTKERNAHILKVQHLTRNKAAIQKERDTLRREAENCRCQSKEAAEQEKKLNALTAKCENLKKERRLQARRTGAMIDAITRERDDAKREVEKLRRQCQSFGMTQVNLNKVRAERNKMRRERDAMKTEMDALRLEIQNLSRPQ